MTFGKDIGGFRYVYSGKSDDGLSGYLYPNANIIDIAAIALNNGPMRSITALTNKSTQSVLVAISGILDQTLQPPTEEQFREGQTKKIGEGGLAGSRMRIGREYVQATAKQAKIEGGLETEPLTEREKYILNNPGYLVITPEWKNLRTKLEELFIENRDMDKSVERGWRDVVKGNPLKTEMKSRIREELLEPLKDYISREPTIKESDKADLLSQMADIENKHFASRTR